MRKSSAGLDFFYRLKWCSSQRALHRFSFRLNSEHAAVARGVGCRLIAADIAENAVTDADVLIADACLAQYLARLGHLEHFLRSVDPARAEPDGICSVHEIAENERTVLDICGNIAVG